MSRLSFACASAAVALVAAALVACGSTKEIYVDEPIDPPAAERDAGFDTKPSPDSGLGVLQFRPAQSYSGFDGEHTFKVPIAVYDSADDLTVTATDPSAVTIAPVRLAEPTGEDGVMDNGKYFLVTVKEAGTITLEAESGGRTAGAKIDVTAYPPGRWADGETRYMNGGGGEPPCAKCHAGGRAVDHSPAALATATDEKVAIVITTGISTHGFPILIDGKPGHKWTVTEAERDGLVTYLRALEPRGFE